ncbi:MAG: hypothetical protein HZB26_06160 [Candidatus Hydrogenedentes bacterium]|nr:hypothetical protein [Candidatus Hydrogenedentota bacterium]
MSKRSARITAICGSLVLLITCGVLYSKTPAPSWPIDAISRAEAEAIINGPDIPEPTPVTPEAFRAAFHDDEAPSLIDKMTAEEMFQRFGTPLEIRGAYWADYKVYTRLHLSSDSYVMYPGGVEFHVEGGTLKGVAYHEPRHFFADKVQVGSTMDDVYAVVDRPVSTKKMSPMVINEAGEWRWRSNCEGVLVNDRLYWRTWRAGIGVHFAFRDHQVTGIFLLPTKVAEGTPYSANSTPAISSVKPLRKIYEIRVPSTGSWWHSWGKPRRCDANLRQLGTALAAYSNEHQDRFPALDARPGHFMFRAEYIFPKYATDATLLVCPNTAYSTKGQSESPENRPQVDDQCYWYLGYAVFDELEGLALLAAYRDALRNHLGFDRDLPIPYRTRAGTLGRAVLLRQGVERSFIVEINNDAIISSVRKRIPVIIERPGHHWRQGGYVLFMDGHVEWRDYPGPFPMTPAFIEGLINLETKFAGS